jgi:WhiB family redox-sensing transcriptional regulator
MDKPVDIREWSDKGNCRSMDSKLFFEEPAPQQVIHACQTCPVVKECLEWAIHYEGWGYWGGTSARQRNKLRGRLNFRLGNVIDGEQPANYTPPSCGSANGYKAHLKVGQFPIPLAEGGCGCWDEWSRVSKERKAKSVAKRKVKELEKWESLSKKEKQAILKAQEAERLRKAEIARQKYRAKKDRDAERQREKRAKAKELNQSQK